MGALDIPPEVLEADDEGDERGGAGCASVAAKRSRGGGWKHRKSAGKDEVLQPRKRARHGRQSVRRREKERLAKTEAKTGAEDVARDDIEAEVGDGQQASAAGVGR